MSGKKTPTPKSQEKCAKCNKPATDKNKLSVTCDLCKGFLCSDCHGLSPTEIRVLELKTVARVMTFLCRDCKTTMVQLPTILQKLNSLTEEVKQLRIRQSMLATESAIQEISERANRSTNIIMYDLPESTSDIAEDRKTHDIAECTKVITKITNKADCTRIKAFRLGAPKSDAGAAPRPLKVIMNSKNEALDILRNKHKLQKPSSIAADLTPMQREYLKYLREELEKRKSEGEKDLTIKYVQGRPTIVNQIKKN
ncbi:hypothetical protein O0L34_g4450 [Tuta absoluta]|nr:hypothetical protein O0L34_g4450 [Tuta absoluta]